MTEHPRVVGSQSVYEGRVIDLRVDEMEVEPGKTIRREVISHPGAVVVIAEDADGSILWVRQYRHAAGRDLLELPAGTTEPGEDPEATARRELAEETGYQASSWKRLGGFYSAPGFCSEYLTAFAAKSLTRADGFHADEDEDIEVERRSLDESLRRVDAGEVEDAKSIATLLLYLRSRTT